MRITFLGAAGTVTGSKYLIEHLGRRILVDCGLFQGLKQLRLRNREPFAVDPAVIDAVLLTHAHLDHSGYLPLLVRDGFGGPIYCTPRRATSAESCCPTAATCRRRKRSSPTAHGYSQHHPALPLYTEADARRLSGPAPAAALRRRLRPRRRVDRRVSPAPATCSARRPILLAAPERASCSRGDLGRADDPLLPRAPVPGRRTTSCSSRPTGTALHPPVDPLAQLEEVIRRTSARGGSVLIPAFAVGRAQTLLYLLHRLRSEAPHPGPSDLPRQPDGSARDPSVSRRTRGGPADRRKSGSGERGGEGGGVGGGVEGDRSDELPPDHHLRERDGHRRAGSPSPEGVRAGSSQLHPLRRLSGGGNARRDDRGRGASGEDPRGDGADRRGGRISGIAFGARGSERAHRMAARRRSARRARSSSRTGSLGGRARLWGSGSGGSWDGLGGPHHTARAWS